MKIVYFSCFGYWCWRVLDSSASAFIQIFCAFWILFPNSSGQLVWRCVFLLGKRTRCDYVALFCCLPGAVKESGKQAGITFLIFSPVCPTRYQQAGKRLVFVSLVHYRSVTRKREKDWYLSILSTIGPLPESGKKTGICQSCPLSVRLVTRKREKDLSFPLWAWLGMRKRKGSSRDYVARLCAWIGERSGKEIDATVVQFSLMSGWFGGRSGEVWC